MKHHVLLSPHVPNVSLLTRFSGLITATAVLSISLSSCNILDDTEDRNIYRVTSIYPDIPGQEIIVDNWEPDSPDYTFTLYQDSLSYHRGDTVSLDIGLEVTEGNVEFVDIALMPEFNNHWPYFNSLEEYQRSKTDEFFHTRVYDFKYYYFEDGKLDIKYRFPIPLDFPITVDEGLTLSFYHGDAYLIGVDELRLRIEILP